MTQCDLVIAGLFGFGAWAACQQERPRSVVVEETFEMVGMTLAIIALLIHFRSRGYRVRLDAG